MIKTVLEYFLSMNPEEGAFYSVLFLKRWGYLDSPNDPNGFEAPLIVKRGAEVKISSSVLDEDGHWNGEREEETFASSSYDGPWTGPYVESDEYRLQQESARRNYDMYYKRKKAEYAAEYRKKFIAAAGGIDVVIDKARFSRSS